MKYLAWIIAVVVSIVAHVVAFLLFDVLRVRRKLVIDNISIAFDNKLSNCEMAKIGRSSVASFLQTILEFIFARIIYSNSKVSFSNVQMAKDIVSQGRGVYGLALHQGNWELLCHKASVGIAPLHMALKPVGGPRIAEWVRSRRESLSVHEIPRKAEKPAWQKIYDVMRSGEIVAFVVDQRRKKGVLAKLFSQECMTNASIFRQWKGYRAPIVPVSIRRTGLLSHEVRFWEPFVVVENVEWSEEKYFFENCVRMNKLVEEMILWNPNEYFWMHNRYKVRL